MKKLIRGIIDFQSNLTDEQRRVFAKIAEEQNSDALFISCADSRVVPDQFASTDPGDLFMVRNVGNLVPPMSSTVHGTGVQAALEFALIGLNVSDVIVCGHSECGAMKGLIEGCPSGCPHLEGWLQVGQESLRRWKAGSHLDSTLSPVNQLSQVNVLQQVEHILSYPFVRERVENGILEVHAWWFNIKDATVYAYNPNENQFSPIA